MSLSYSERKAKQLTVWGKQDGGATAAIPLDAHALATLGGPGASQGGGDRGGERGNYGDGGACQSGRGAWPGGGAYLVQQWLWQGYRGPMTHHRRLSLLDERSGCGFQRKRDGCDPKGLRTNMGWSVERGLIERVYIHCCLGPYLTFLVSGGG